MKIDRDALEIQHREDARRFEIRIGDDVAVLDYYLNENTITFTHTGVPQKMEGNGIGSLIVRAGLDHAREQGHKVVPLCSFVDAYIRRHPEYGELAANGV
ncbi:MAG: hypothetical protein B5M51_08070 [Anaerolinea sp. 4484_236]|nr:MAG: hypothetical protein B5M51_08070 [Anaerolinea sp. 4484_236]